MNVVSILRLTVYLSIFQILLISFFLYIKRGGNKYNRILLAALLIIWSTFTGGSLILITAGLPVIMYNTGHLLNLTIFLTAPLLYIYFKTLFIPQHKLDIKQLGHSILFLVSICYMGYQILVAKHIQIVFYPVGVYLIAALFLQNIIYFYFILRKMRNIEGSRYKSRLKIFRFLLFSALVIFILKLAIFVVWNILKYNDICIFMTDIFFTVVFIIVNSLMMFTLLNPDLIAGSFKYTGSELSDGELQEKLKIISAYLLQDRKYSDPLISLERLSKNLKISEKIISQVINQSSGYNFNDYINSFRISYVKDLMNDPTRKILEIAYEAGFNSKTTFNSAFKKFTGKTPSDYRKDLAEQENNLTSAEK